MNKWRGSLKDAYSGLWGYHAQVVRKLSAKLVGLFPVLQLSYGFGANTGQWLNSVPVTKAEPDITLYHRGKPLCIVEVTGSSRVCVPPHPMWVRLDKVRLAEREEAKGIRFWFYLVFPNDSWVIDTPTVAKFRSQVVYPTIHDGIAETYVQVPWQHGLPPSSLFNWLSERIRNEHL